GKERIAGEFGAKRRLWTMAGIDDGPRREAMRQQANRGDQRVPVAERQVGATDGAREENVAREETALGVVGKVRGRVARNQQGLESDPGQIERLVALEQDLGGVWPQRQFGGREVVDPLERDSLPGGHVDGRSRRFGQVGDPAEVIPMSVSDQDPGASDTEPLELAAKLGRVAARIDHDSLRGLVRGADDVAIRRDRSEFVALDGEAHDSRVYGPRRRERLVRILRSCGAGSLTRSRRKAVAADPSCSTLTWPRAL